MLSQNNVDASSTIARCGSPKYDIGSRPPAATSSSQTIHHEDSKKRKERQEHDLFGVGAQFLPDQYFVGTKFTTHVI